MAPSKLPPIDCALLSDVILEWAEPYQHCLLPPSLVMLAFPCRNTGGLVLSVSLYVEQELSKYTCNLQYLLSVHINYSHIELNLVLSEL